MIKTVHWGVTSIEGVLVRVPRRHTSDPDCVGVGSGVGVSSYEVTSPASEEVYLFLKK